MKKLIKFLFSKLFWINLLLALAVLYVVFYYTMDYLDDYTNHGVKIEVPTLLGVDVDDVEDTLMDKELRFAIREGGHTVGAGVVTEIIE